MTLLNSMFASYFHVTVESNVEISSPCLFDTWLFSELQVKFQVVNETFLFVSTCKVSTNCSKPLCLFLQHNTVN